MKFIPRAVKVGRDYEGFDLVRIRFPHGGIHYAVDTGLALIVYDNNRFWLPW